MNSNYQSIQLSINTITYDNLTRIQDVLLILNFHKYHLLSYRIYFVALQAGRKITMHSKWPQNNNALQVGCKINLELKSNWYFIQSGNVITESLRFNG
ncbi:MAG: hypothetical protein DRR16_22850 [Candidatus Parabeggiatoa sp. nov. 3]|nr:MAG: hypothetical protein DRR00_26205 [Gammaproteobacteria bacterium]RKZ60341.1 MAG: hypothetical protein DRQ99_22235 [Gammaproteobacteria bacterium]RKZ81021.1 MAG: hypothetical protein DRR16_22850 [Gammaproteobacteria bacterium]